MNSKAWGLALVLWVIYAVVACNPKIIDNGEDDEFIPTLQKPEVSYGSPQALSGVTITGSAGFEYRTYDTIGGGLGAVTGPKPIRYAEVRVTNSAGTLIQSTETDVNGDYSFIIPASAGTFRVAVTSRSNNSHLKAYVYDDPRYNNYYSISTSFTALASQTITLMTAPATGTAIGGAFNILDQILEANDYLRSEVSGCATDFPTDDCQNFTVADRVTAYWKLGFSPAAYYDDPGSGLSFYLPGYSRLFILGGIEGDSTTEDTDHFDNSVILHEYGHFLEDTQFESDSPGGAHDGNAVVDPRLAWSEGWGNFFQAAVRGTPDYIDTYGTGATSGDLINYGIESQNVDVPRYAGEGNFREFSITRFLWDVIDNAADSMGSTVGGNGPRTDNVSGDFKEIYFSLFSPTRWKRSTVEFRQVGHLHAFQAAITYPAHQDWTDIQFMEGQTPNASQYGYYVSGSITTCGDYTMNFGKVTLDLLYDGGSTYIDNGSDGMSHLLYNNDFYHLHITGTQSVSLVLTYTDTGGPGTADLDLTLFNSSAEISAGTPDAIARSELTPSGGGPYTETITRTLGTGDYLIDVRAYTGGMANNTYGSADYYLTLNGSRLCPAPYP